MFLFRYVTVHKPPRVYDSPIFTTKRSNIAHAKFTSSNEQKFFLLALWNKTLLRTGRAHLGSLSGDEGIVVGREVHRFNLVLQSSHGTVKPRTRSTG